MSALLASLGAEVSTTFERLPFTAVRLPAGSLQDLADVTGVRVIDVNAPVRAASVSARATARVPAQGAADYWSASSDVAIAVVDSGVNAHAERNRGSGLDPGKP